VPKGVILSHMNMVSGILSLTPMALRPVTYIDDNDTYIAFLPLAHVLEICAEHVMLLLGVKIGYSSPNTLTDTSTMIPKGGKGDATVLRVKYSYYSISFVTWKIIGCSFSQLLWRPCLSFWIGFTRAFR
jgi:hypothetical protein